jgi:hypothetical protein
MVLFWIANKWNAYDTFLKKNDFILGDADYRWGFTTMDNTAEYTAKVALDPATQWYLRVAGDLINPLEMKSSSEVTAQFYSDQVVSRF